MRAFVRGITVLLCAAGCGGAAAPGITFRISNGGDWDRYYRPSVSREQDRLVVALRPFSTRDLQAPDDSTITLSFREPRAGEKQITRKAAAELSVAYDTRDPRTFERHSYRFKAGTITLRRVEEGWFVDVDVQVARKDRGGAESTCRLRGRFSMENP